MKKIAILLALVHNTTKELRQSLIDVLLSYKDAEPNTWKRNAYLKAVDTIRETNSKTLERLAKEGTWSELGSIGKSIEEKLNIWLKTGRLKVKVKDISGPKPRSKKSKFQRTKLAPLVNFLLKSLAKVCTKVEAVGSWRREKPEVGDLEFLCSGSCTSDTIVELLKKTKSVRIISILWKGKQKLALHAASDKFKVSSIQLEFRFTTPSSWGAAILEATGSSTFNILMRHKAKQLGFKLNHLGLWDGETKVAGKDEKQIFKKLNMGWVPPTKR